MVAVIVMAGWMKGRLRSGTWVEPQAMVDMEGEGVWQWTAGKIGDYRGANRRLQGGVISVTQIAI